MDDLDLYTVKITSRDIATEHKVHMPQQIADEDYSDLIDILYTARESDHIYMIMDNVGGDCRVGYQIAHAMKSSPATITVIVSYNCSSMAAVLALCGDSLIMHPGSTLMFHNYSAEHYGKGRELTTGVKELNEQLKQLTKNFCSPFLTDAEINKLSKDEDIYVRAWDKNLKQRMDRHFTIIESDFTN